VSWVFIIYIVNTGFDIIKQRKYNRQTSYIKIISKFQLENTFVQMALLFTSTQERVTFFQIRNLFSENNIYLRVQCPYSICLYNSKKIQKSEFCSADSNTLMSFVLIERMSKSTFDVGIVQILTFA